MRPFLSIAHNTCRECIRQPIFIVILLTCVAIIGLYPAMALFVFRGQQKLVTDGSLASILLFGQICAVLCASHSISREIETGTVQIILAKPIGRMQFFLAKLVGVWGAISLFFLICALPVLISLKAATDQFRFDPYLFSGIFVGILAACVFGAARNYYARKPFPSAAATGLAAYMLIFGTIAFFMPKWNSFSYEWKEGPAYFNAEVAKELILIYAAIVVMASLATTLSAFLKLAANMTICLIIYIFGLMADWIYTNLANIQVSTIEQMIRAWPFWILPLILFFWWLSTIRYPYRRNPDIPAIEIHATFVILTGMDLIRCVHDLIEPPLDIAPSPVLRAVAVTFHRFRSQLAAVIYSILPNWQQLWLADAISRQKQIPWEYIATAGLYTLAFVAFLTILGIIIFSVQDLNQSSQI